MRENAPEEPIPLRRRRALPWHSFAAACGSVRDERLFPRPQPWLLGSGSPVPREVSRLQVGVWSGAVGGAAVAGATPGSHPAT